VLILDEPTIASTRSMIGRDPPLIAALGGGDGDAQHTYPLHAHPALGGGRAARGEIHGGRKTVDAPLAELHARTAKARELFARVTAHDTPAVDEREARSRPSRGGAAFAVRLAVAYVVALAVRGARGPVLRARVRGVFNST